MDAANYLIMYEKRKLRHLNRRYAIAVMLFITLYSMDNKMFTRQSATIYQIGHQQNMNKLIIFNLIASFRLELL